jgi:hypothetical protein
VDHYKPKSKFPDFECVYSNLFYACPACNRRKGIFWPTDEEWSLGSFIPNPCDHSMAEHLRYGGARVEPLTTAGRRAEEDPILNGEIDVRYREIVLQTIAAYKFNFTSGLAAITALEAELDRAQEELKRDEILLERREIQNQLERLKRALEDFTGLKLT